jgi:uncharacterized C2H2 Zn-finger protein
MEKDLRDTSSDDDSDSSYSDPGVSVKKEGLEVSDFLELEIKKEKDGEELLCPQCMKVFSQRPNLQKHVLTVHEGRKDFECEFCGKQVILTTCQGPCRAHGSLALLALKGGIFSTPNGGLTAF